MAASLSAILSIAAKVTGQGAIDAIGGAVKKLDNTSKMATGTLKGLAGSAGGLGGALGALAPVLSVAGLVTLATGSIKAAAGLYDLSQKTGVSVEMLAKFKKAASTSGTDLDAVVGGLTKLSKAMAAAATDSGLGRKTKAEIDAATTAIKEGERAQTDAVKRQADARVDALRDESDRRLGEISRRYRREEQILNDRWDDQADKEDKAAEKRLNAQLKTIGREYDAKRKALRDDASLTETAREQQLQKLQDDEDAALEIVRDGAAKQAKERQRAARDSQQQTLDQLNGKRAAEEKIVKDGSDRQQQIVKDGADKQIETLKKLAEEAIKALKVDPGANALEQQMEELGLSGEAASEAFRKLGVTIKNQDGTLRGSDAVLLDIANKFKTMTNPVEKTALAMKLFGRSGADLVPLLSKGGDAIEELKVKMTTAFAEDAKKYTIELTKLNGKIGAIGGSIAIVLLPAMEALAGATGAIVDVFSKLPGPLQGIIGGFTLLAIGLAALAPFLLILGPAFTAIGTAIGFIVAGGLAATIAGWLGALVPLISTITTLAAGLGTVASLLIGWPLVIGAALVAIGVLLYSFRDQIGAFAGAIVQAFVKGFSALGGIAVKAWQAVSAGFTTYVSGPIGKAWTSLVGFLGTALSNVTGGITRLWTGMVNGIKGALRGLLQFAANALNGVIGAINRVIQGINVARAAVNMGPLGQMSYIQVPAFAEGGVVNRPTLAMVGEGGQAEYIIPASKMAAASANYLGGSRGASVLTGGSRGGVTPQINIQTGPVMQTADGQQWVSLADLERAQRQTVAAVMGQLRTPAGRYAVGAR